MVERLKAAIEKAREQRAGAAAGSAAGGAAAAGSHAGVSTGVASRAGVGASVGATSAWDDAPALTLDPDHLERERIVTFDRTHAANMSFDVLRTRLLRACADHGWRRIGVCSPTKNCGKSVTCVNLALSLARRGDQRTLVIDLDLRRPRIAHLLGLGGRRRIREWLIDGAEPPLARVGGNLLFALNTVAEPDAAEVLHSPATAAAIGALCDARQPDLALLDLPPLLVCDDTVGMLPALDAVLLVAAAGQTRPKEIEQCEALMHGQTAFAGIILTKHDASIESAYNYGYAD